MLEIGQVIDGKYKILREIGRGGMSVVYLAADERLNKIWAVKEIRQKPGSRADRAVMEYARAEADLMKRFEHPALPRIVDIIDDGESLKVVMDYVEGQTLKEVLAQSSPLEETEVVNWVRQIADVLCYLHEQPEPVIYRDMKPENLILRPDGRISIIDFGIARVYDPDKTKDTTVLGTAGYAPPEQYTGQTDPRSDIYALGMTMHELLTGVVPQRAISYKPVRQWSPGRSEAIEAVVDKCVRQKPEERFQTCRELIHALDDPRKTIWEYRRRKSKSPWDVFHTIPGIPPRSEDISCARMNELAESLPLNANAEVYHTLIGHTKYTEPERLARIDWSKLRHLHMICGPYSAELDKMRTYGGIQAGGYCSRDGTWMLVIGADADRIKKSIAACGASLETLHIRYTDIRIMELSNLRSLKDLQLSENRWLQAVYGIYEMNDLERLRISNCQVGALLNVRFCASLRELDISRTGIREVFAPDGLISLTHCNAADSALETAGFIENAPELETLILENCWVSRLPSLSRLRKLRTLRLAGTKITELPDVDALESLEILDCTGTQLGDIADSALPGGLQDLSLGGTRITRIPEAVRNLPLLRYLDLSRLRLEELPDWLPEIADEFTTQKRVGPDKYDHTTILGFAEDDETGLLEEEMTGLLLESWCTVNLYATQVQGVDMSIFNQPMHMILQWFEARKQTAELPEQEAPLNEIKVVFLGDGEAGKSLVVARLLNDGAYPEDFDGNATPGIAIRDLEYELDGRRVQVHFWDFGGQEILHSMHRMFLTKRTLYVILLNARDDTQDDRARYWLHNVKSFADGAPVLLALNKLDQNPKASVNERDLRSMYPGLTEIVRMSALKDPREAFNDTFTAALKRQIGAFETLESPFLPAWNRLKERLRNMTQPYILSSEYQRISEECGVAEDEETRTALLNWFNDLGVSFCYSGSAKLEDYVILRPDWITNAVYILMYNPIEGLKNGIVSHDAIYRMLCPENDRRADIKCVLPGVAYSKQDTAYVLNVVRRFRLSYRIEDDVEFIPMLCLRDSMDVAEEYASDPGTMEFRMIYEYLPNNVIHRLMVYRNRDLDVEHVWLTGARFHEKANGLSAVVKAEGSALKIYVRSTNLRHPAVYYLDSLRSVIEQINDEMGLQIVERQIAFKDDGIVECFDYDMLSGALEAGQTTYYSKRRRRLLQIDQILSQSDHHVDRDRRDLIRAVIRTCGQMQANHLYWGTNENTRNTFVRDSLINAGYYVADQSLAGLGAGGKQPGELDMLIRREQGVPWTIYEGLILSGTGRSQLDYWDAHLKKLLDNYNENGLQFLILVSYVTCARERFPEVCRTFNEHIRTFSPGSYAFRYMEPIDQGPDRYELPHHLCAYRCTYDCGGYQTSVYHIFARMNPKPD